MRSDRRPPGPGIPPRALLVFAAAWFLVAGVGISLYYGDRGGPAPEVLASWLRGGDGAPAPAPGAPPARVHGPRMPNFELATMEGGRAHLFPGEEAPAVVTEWLAFCPDCAPAAELFPELAAEITGAGQRVVNVAYMGRPDHVRRYLKGKDFGGPVLLDQDARMQRHFGIGTFTVWLLAPDGTILFQGTPARARPYLAQHLAFRNGESAPISVRAGS